MNWSERQLLVIIDGILFARILGCRLSQNRDIPLSKESFVFQVIILFVLMCQNVIFLSVPVQSFTLHLFI